MAWCTFSFFSFLFFFLCFAKSTHFIGLPSAAIKEAGHEMATIIWERPVRGGCQPFCLAKNNKTAKNINFRGTVCPCLPLCHVTHATQNA
ncbi:hypothetical protein BC940DRAFT_291095 [Gongronella butleri]|nr:hypothetical protein BC940DRAFT_291095 [Gongronella butleri]